MRGATSDSPRYHLRHPMNSSFLLLQAFKELYQSLALAGARSTVHIKITGRIVDGKEGDTLYIERLAQCASGVPQLMAMHVLFLHLGLPGILVGVDRDRYEGYVLVLQLFLKLLQLGNLAQARYAPAGPHVDIYIFATEGAEVNYIAITVLKYDTSGEGLSGYGSAILHEILGMSGIETKLLCSSLQVLQALFEAVVIVVLAYIACSNVVVYLLYQQRIGIMCLYLGKSTVKVALVGDACVYNTRSAREQSCDR